MKTSARVLLLLAAVAFNSSGLASGTDTSAYQGALFNGDSKKFYDTVHSGGPTMLSVTVSIQQQKRTLRDPSGWTEEIKANHLDGILGLDLTKWLTLYGGGGAADVSKENLASSSNGEFLFGGTIRVLDYMVLEPWNDIDNYWVGIDLNSYYRSSSLDYGSYTADMSEVFGSLTMSIYTRPERPGVWDRLGFYIGPAVSTLSVGNQKEDQMFGFIGGVQLNPNPNMGLKLEVQQFDGMGMGASFVFHF